ncbi:hypothetical protein L2E82_01422 [Cichorium intybus]|uniref:Uncharacterized protein n=1 Tax=Cichorium intybus TaxID=13427 RepID=A0ACB9GZZ1_CICIN|nr:hypothetical protein L2E82_01422 [Cichorium intybus]
MKVLLESGGYDDAARFQASLEVSLSIICLVHAFWVKSNLKRWVMDGYLLLSLGDFGLARVTSETDFMTEYVVRRWYHAPKLLLSSLAFFHSRTIFTPTASPSHFHLRPPPPNTPSPPSYRRENGNVIPPVTAAFLKHPRTHPGGGPGLEYHMAESEHLMKRARVGSSDEM